MIIGFERRIAFNTVSIEFRNDIFKLMVKFLGFTNLFLTICQLLLWMILNAEVVISKGFQLRFEKLKKRLYTYKENNPKITAVRETLKKSFSNLSLNQKLSIIELNAKMDGYDHVIPFLEYITCNILFLMENSECVFIVFLIIIYLFALLQDLYIFYSLPLFTIILKYKTL